MAGMWSPAQAQDRGVPWTFPFFLSSSFPGTDFDHFPLEFSSLQATRASLRELLSLMVALPLIISIWIPLGFHLDFHLDPDKLRHIFFRPPNVMGEEA